ncbi:hypothetical protein AVEN_141233-1 [Araneus ventricosus]|uniref:Uncharacterized protein n=1 Tax=Araneus ventricosus TaxID=182803 RepID=A0A4Y2RJ45_ARAVE|nr:hypothetical protein AVEN_141233-1 [Araneus ventricosus]
MVYHLKCRSVSNSPVCLSIRVYANENSKTQQAGKMIFDLQSDHQNCRSPSNLGPNRSMKSGPRCVLDSVHNKAKLTIKRDILWSIRENRGENSVHNKEKLNTK